MTTLSIKVRDVNRLCKRQNPRKAVGSDSVSTSTLKHCANQLSPLFTGIFNTYLETCHVPACFKTSTIIPIPKMPRITGLNYYRPVALTYVVIKSFEPLVLSHLKAITDPLLDPLQFAYRANRSADNAVNMTHHLFLQHLDSSGTYARILFLDFSSAFNTIIPALLQGKLRVPDSISSITKKAQQRMYCLWQLKKFNLPKTMMVHFYTAIMESILTSSITVCGMLLPLPRTRIDCSM